MVCPALATAVSVHVHMEAKVSFSAIFHLSFGDSLSVNLENANSTSQGPLGICLSLLNSLILFNNFFKI